MESINFLIWFFDFGKYLCFSVLIGHIALQFIPENRKPKVKVPPSVLFSALVGIIVFSLGPLITTIYYFRVPGEMFSLILSAFFKLNIGHAWIFTFVFSILLGFFINRESFKYLQAVIMLLLIFAVSYSSHTVSLSLAVGFPTQTLHYLAIMLWTGIVMNVAWFSKKHENWSHFLKWFTPFAITCVVIMMISGLVLMNFIVEPKDYVKSWTIPYGQMLLLKHISIIPVLFFAIVNGILMKKVDQDKEFEPLKWMKAESILLFFTFFFTGIMSNLSTAQHNIESIVKIGKESKWAEWITGEDFIPPLSIELNPTIPASILLVLSVYFLYLIVDCFKKSKPLRAIWMGIGFIVLFYLGLMLSFNA